MEAQKTKDCQSILNNKGSTVWSNLSSSFHIILQKQNNTTSILLKQNSDLEEQTRIEEPNVF